MNITINEKDLNKYKPIIEINGKKYPHSYSASGMLIDELAFASKQWTSEDLYENNMEYESQTPYDYDYEDDLFIATKKADQLYKLAQFLEVSINANWERLAKEQKLQAGACIALNNPEQWQELLTAYTDKLQEDRTDGISKDYNDQLQKELDSYHDDEYREWLNGDHRDYNGVIYEISKYFTNNTNGSYDKKSQEYTFELSEDDIEKAKDAGYKKNQLKSYLLSEIIDSCKAQEYKNKQEREKRKAERERLAKYKAEQAEEEKAERIAKLSAMKIK